MTVPFSRPEDRRRAPVETPAWPESEPACFRSEAFAEDLPFVGAPRTVSGTRVPRQRAAPWRSERWRDAAAALRQPLGVAASLLRL